jgi:hypothetical protein
MGIVFSSSLSQRDVAHLGRHIAAYVGWLPTERRGVLAGDLLLSAPIPVYTVPPAALKRRRGLLVAARRVGVECLVVAGGEAVADVTLIDRGRGRARTLEFAGIRVGPTASAITDAVQRAEGLLAERAAGAEYEARMLRVPALFFTAFWLHGPEEDLVVPVAIRGSDGDATVVLNDEQLTERLAPVAGARGAARRPKRGAGRRA